MMSFRLRIILLIVILAAMIYIIRLVKKKVMDLRYALLWIVISIGIIILTVFPQILDMAAGFLGIASPVNMLFFFGFCFSIVIIFSLSISLSRLSEKTKRLAQEIAIMKKDLYEKIEIHELKTEGKKKETHGQ